MTDEAKGYLPLTVMVALQYAEDYERKQHECGRRAVIEFLESPVCGG